MTMNCPFCGAERVENLVVDVFSYDCMTDIWSDALGKYADRDTICYERELARKDALLERTEKIIKAYQGLKRETGSASCICPRCQELEKEAQALLVDLELSRNNPYRKTGL